MGRRSRSAAAAIVGLAGSAPLVVVHGGGRAIDAEIRARGNTPHFVDGLRVTDAAALDVVICGPRRTDEYARSSPRSARPGAARSG